MNVQRILQTSLTVLSAAAVPLGAQRTLVEPLGARLRVQPTADTTWRVGRLIGTAPDMLRLRSCDTCSAVDYALSALKAVEVSKGRKPRGRTVLRGTMFGVMLGTAAGALAAKRHSRSCGDDTCFSVLLVPMGSVAGLVAGTTIGALIRYDEWRPAVIR